MVGKTNEAEFNVAGATDLFAKKISAKAIFGSNLALTRKTVVVGGGKNINDWPKTPWAAIAAAREMMGKKPISLVVVEYFKGNPDSV